MGEKEWMNAPLPPLSKSIIESGLVVGEYSIAKVPGPPKKPRSSSTINMSSVKKSIPKIMSQRPTKANDSDLLTENDSFVTSSAKTSRPINTNTPSPKKKSKQPVEQFHIYSKEERDIIYQHEQKPKIPEKINIDYLYNSSRMKSERPIDSETFRKNFKLETNEIINELDKNISSIHPNIEEIDINKLPIENQTELKSKLLQFYNFSFNKIILQERPMSTERALLMRRLQKFYNQLFNDIPLLMNNIQSFKTDFNQKYETLLQKLKETESNANNLVKENLSLKSQVSSLSNQIQSLTDSSNEKDIQMSTKAFDLDLAKCQTAQFQFKLQAKKDKIKALKNTIEKLEESNKCQLNQIENLTKTINKFKLGDTGYISMYHKALEKNEELESKIKQLENEVLSIKSIEKAEVETQTDLVEKQIFMPQIISPLKTLKKERRGSAAVLPSFLPQKTTKKGRRGSGVVLPKNIILISEKQDSIEKVEEKNIDKSENNVEETKKSFSKTQPVSLNKNQEDFQQKTETKETKELVDVEVQTITEKISSSNSSTSTASNKTTKPTKTKEEKIDKYSQFKLPDDYSIDHSMLNKLPDMFNIIMPFFSHLCSPPCDQELQFINSLAYPSNYKSDKPVFWAIQLIHSFLTDSFVQSFQNESYTTLEAIFVEWITARYSLPHLVQQVIGEFSYILLNERQKVPYLSFFTEILVSSYSFSQICFLSTVYTFSFELTFPSINSFLQNSSADDDDDFYYQKQIMIHIECVERIIANIFLSKEIALQFVQKEFYDPCFNSKNPMINYFDFLLKSTILFGNEHQDLHQKTKNLLLLCGCFDPMGINYESFVKFFSIIGFGYDFSNEFKFDSKSEWKKAVKKKKFDIEQQDKSSENYLLMMSELLPICAEKKKPLVRLFEMESMIESISRIKSLNSIVLECYYNLQLRFSNFLPKIIEKLNPKITKKIEEYYEKLRRAILRADVGAIVYAYRLMLNKIDKLEMKEKGFIPFNPLCNPDAISKLIEYVDRTESISFALIDVT